MLRLFAQYLDRPRERRGGRVMARCREAQIMAKRTIRRQRLAVHAAVRDQRRDILARVSDPVSGERSEIILHRLERRAHLFGLLGGRERSEEHTSELQSLMRISYAVFCLKKKKTDKHKDTKN